MKKLLIYIAILASSLLLVACNDDIVPPIAEEDKIPPIILIDASKTKLIVNQNQDVDLEVLLMDGVTAIDNVDDNLTENIVVIYDEVDMTTPGEYSAYFTLQDSAKNNAEIKSKTVIVLPVYEVIKPYEVYLGLIEGEKPKPDPQKVFGGAYYHKVHSSKDKWTGIEATVVLPDFEIKRYSNPDYDATLNVDPTKNNQDNPSVYMGGHGAYESDVGLSLSPAYLKSADSPSTGSMAFRPFWRYITNPNAQNKDIGGYDLPNGRKYAVTANHNGTNMAANWHWMDTEFYYLPGDKVRMLVYSPQKDHLQLQIELIEVSTLPSSVKTRLDNGWNRPANFISPIFPSEGHGGHGNAEFKRVNAIDQKANEGKDAIPTNTIIKEAIWENVYLYRNINGKTMRVPFNDSRSQTMSAPIASYFNFTAIDPITGGQKVSIDPKNGTKEGN